jgi:hypothetical protein
MIRVVHPGSGSWIFTHMDPGYPDPGVKKAPDPGSREVPSFSYHSCLASLLYLLLRCLYLYAYEEMFHDLHENNVASALFEQSCDTSPWATKENIARSTKVQQAEPQSTYFY